MKNIYFSLITKALIDSMYTKSNDKTNYGIQQNWSIPKVRTLEEKKRKKQARAKTMKRKKKRGW